MTNRPRNLNYLFQISKVVVEAIEKVVMALKALEENRVMIIVIKINTRIVLNDITIACAIIEIWVDFEGRRDTIYLTIPIRLTSLRRKES